MRRFLTLALSALLVVSSCFAKSSHKKHLDAQNSVFALYGHSDSHDLTLGLCTAFAFKRVNDGYLLLTEGHCFEGAPEDATYAVAEQADGKDLQPVEVLKHVDDGAMDAAELHLKTAKKYPVLELDNQAPQLDDEVFTVGFPEMVGKATFTGHVALPQITDSPSVDGEACDICLNRILVQIGGGPGASGSPVVSEKTGKVIGILEGHLFENGIVVVSTPQVQNFLAPATQPKDQK